MLKLPRSLSRLSLILCIPLILTACYEPIAFNDPIVEEAPDIGSPFIGGTTIPLVDFGYEEKEYFYSGEAHSYTSATPLQSHGMWHVTPADSANYKSRMLVYRPTDPTAFNGTVVVEWLNVTAGIDAGADWVFLHTELLRKGYAWVGISAQALGIEGGDAIFPLPLPVSMALKDRGPERYASLSHPGDSFSYDIFAQAVQAIRHPQGVAPLEGLQIQRVLATGDSQSASRLITFIDAFGTRTDLFDGYMVHSRLGDIPEAEDSIAPLSQAPQTEVPVPDDAIVRRDLFKPVMNVQTETDLFLAGALGSRQNDNHFYRLWEVAGSSHADLYSFILGQNDRGDNPIAAMVAITNSLHPFFTPCSEPVNTAPQHHFVLKAALHALNEWVANGTAPASVPRLTLNSHGDGFEYDEFGNVLGGLRTPYVNVPIATFSGENMSSREEEGICFLVGTTEMLDEATLQSLYPDHDSYVTAVADSTAEAVAQGFLLQEDAELIIEAAHVSYILLFP